jgi:hypothetical protein
MGEARSLVPLERDKNGHRILHHDQRGYAQGCGCKPCKAGHAADVRARRAAASSATPASARRAAAQRDGAAQDEGRRTARSISLSDLEVELTDKAAAEVGMNRSQWVQEAIHEKLLRGWGVDFEALDTARPARRRPNYKRTETEGQQT